jgi:hypothetical protein
MRKFIRFALGLTFMSSLFIWSSIFLQPSIEQANARAGNLLSLKLAETDAQGCSPAQIDVLPSNPTTNDNITIRLAGQWPNACTPRNPTVTVAGGEIRINTSNPGQICAQVITSWNLSVLIPAGSLAARTYQVIVTHSSSSGQCELGRRSFTIGTQTVTVVAHTMSGGPISDIICIVPPAKFSFAPTDVFAYQWTRFSGIRAGDVVRRDFISPNGSLFFTSSDVFPPGSDNCAWDAIPIAGSPAASMPGNWQVRVFYNGVQFLIENFIITAPSNPAPTLTSLSPNSVIAGGAAFTLAVTGANFVPGSVVRWNGADRTTTFVNTTQLTAAILASAVASAGAASVTVVNPAPGGGVSNALNFTIINQSPTDAAVIIDGTRANGDGSASGGVNRNGWLYMQKALENLAARVAPGTAKVVVDLGSSSIVSARDSINSAFNLSSLPQAGWTLRHEDGTANITNWLTNLSTANTGILYIPTYNLATGDLEEAELAAINAQAGRIANFVSNGGALFAMGEVDATGRTGSWGWLRALYPGVNVIDVSDAGVTRNITLTPDGMAAFPGLANADLTGTVRWVNYFVGDLGNLKVLATAPQGANTRQVILGGLRTPPPPPQCPEITSLNPTSGAVGTLLTINGNNFLGVSAARFTGGATATPSINSAGTQITVTVPSGAQSGPIAIIKSGCPDALTQSFTVVTPPPTTRIVRVVSQNGAPDSTVSVPITIDAQGDETGVQFTLNFNPSLLTFQRADAGSDAQNNQFFETNQSQIAQGRIGVILLLRNALARGTRQIAVLTFRVAANVSPGQVIPLTFGNEPTRQRVIDANANALLAEFTAGEIRIAQGAGFEGDVNDDKVIDIIDAQLLINHLAGRQQIQSGGAFQRADCAPRSTRGDGALDITDARQIILFAASGELIPAGGPTAPQTVTALGSPPTGPYSATRRDRSRLQLVQGNGHTLTAMIDARGDESAISFSLQFDPQLVRFAGAAAGADASEGEFVVNTRRLEEGRVGIALLLPSGRRFEPGARALARLSFLPASGDGSFNARMSFVDQPLARLVVNEQAETTAAEFADAAVTIQSGAVVTVPAADYSFSALARDSVAVSFGADLAVMTVAADGAPWPGSLAGTTVLIKDSLDVDHFAPLLFVSPQQVNYLIPPEVAAGGATVTITSVDGRVSTGLIQIAGRAPRH